MSMAFEQKGICYLAAQKLKPLEIEDKVNKKSMIIKNRKKSQHRVVPVKDKSHVDLFSAASLQFQQHNFRNVKKYDQYSLTLITTDITFSFFY